MAVTPSTSERVDTHAVAGQRGFVLFWSGETVSMFGSQVTLLALPLTAVLALHATPGQLGLVRFFEAFPYVLFTLVFGAWVDRRRKMENSQETQTLCRPQRSKSATNDGIGGGEFPSVIRGPGDHQPDHDPGTRAGQESRGQLSWHR